MFSHFDDSTNQPDQSGSPQHLPADALPRCAQLLANGEIDWPSGLSNEQQEQLLSEVRRYRRSRLVKLIASQIAAEIARDR